MADNCGMCLALGEKFGCGWCQSSDRCEVQEQCDRNGGAVWLNRNTTCPNPEVTSFSPQLGPWEGGTNITITGINLGKTFKVGFCFIFHFIQFHYFFNWLTIISVLLTTRYNSQFLQK